jgi:hypothetical protein
VDDSSSTRYPIESSSDSSIVRHGGRSSSRWRE